ncbi:HupE/UreJ family protein [Pseudoponticoccus marisrubri]|uniref:HupE/UreJ protein n=1 Tax=Pseudoponticoccus marisrubri TaxID=1685382 RepID=A0A0W7WM38_9RHOB|nr:HupE/UreJ family protein [Pseudoponticoccus marisrubri]KUF11653.1 hypothetical protein AVJ23_07840 [Pseudoponticoccus marisrubri]
MIRSLVSALLFALSAAAAQAHEVQSAVADFITEGGRLQMEMRLSAEPIVAGIDLEGVQDTNSTEGAERVDALRALPPETLAAQLRDEMPRILAGMNIRADGAPLDMAVSEITVPPVGNVELPRETAVLLAGALPPRAETLQISWPAEFGTLILRQMDMEQGYTGYLTGGTSDPIEIPSDSLLGIAGTYLLAGMVFFAPLGPAHVLFVLALFFLSSRPVPLATQQAAFTLGLLPALIAGTLGILTPPASFLAPLIAASVVYVALEGILVPGGHRGRPALVAGFGLLHGLGLAAALRAFGLPGSGTSLALAGFALGVILAQLLVLGLAFAMVALAQRVDAGRVPVRRGQGVYAALAVAFAAAGWWLYGVGLPQTQLGLALWLWPLAGLSVLCLLSASFVDRLHAYRRFVVVPGLLAIAAAGAGLAISSAL